MLFKNAFVSTSNKTGLVKFIKPLAKNGMRVVSTGGTAKLLKQAGIPVIEIAKQTKQVEVMGGRVKSLHPRIYIPLLARKKDQALLKKEGLLPFDLLVCNLYPFEQKAKQNSTCSLDSLIEWIDVGGPSLLRAGAKNFKYVTVLCDPADYSTILKSGSPNLQKRKLLASKVFDLLARYNACIAKQMSGNWKDGGNFYSSGKFIKTLRYGENPNQKAAWFQQEKEGLHSAKKYQGKDLSFNNLQDLESAIQLLRKFHKPCCVAVKHNNPCGVATHPTSLKVAVKLSLQADPISVFGGILAVNHTVSKEIAILLCPIFLEVIIAPNYSKEALNIFKKKKNLRILEWPHLTKNTIANKLSLHPVTGGFLLQDIPPNNIQWLKEWKFLNKVASPTYKEDLLLAWKVCSQLKSNAIALAFKGQTIGLGMGQVSRIRAVEQAILAWKKLHPNISSPVLASDGFFPFPDSIVKAAEAGIRWIIQPGGSLRDKEILATAKKLSINLIFTGQRCFSH